MSTIETSVMGEQSKWTRLPGKETVNRTLEAVKARGVKAELASDRQEALRLLGEKIPNGSEVMTGASRTLDEIGFTETVAAGKRWKNLKAEIMAEKDPVKQKALRKKSTEAAYFVGSVQAVAETGEIVVASASGSQIPAYAFSADNVIWVAGIQKIVTNLDEALKRVREHALPMESARMKSLGYPGSMIGKILIFERERPGRNISLILVNEKLGF
jgi:L-lactate utilization protein LutC